MASLPYPRSHKTIFPQNSRNTQKRLAEKKNLCTSVQSVGGSYLPEGSVGSAYSVGGYSPPEASVNSVNSVGGLAQTNLEGVLWKEFGGWRGYGRDAIPSYENSHRLHRCAQIRRRVCQNSLILKKSQSPDFHKPGLCYV